MTTTPTAPAKPFRIIRGEAGDYRVHDYTTKERRDAAAARWAERDGENVLTQLWDASHSQDDLNGGWACDGAAYPPGQAPAPAAAGVRGPASLIRPGDVVTVFAVRGTYGGSRDYTGEVAEVEPGRVFGIESRVITLTPTDDARHIVVTAVDTAVTIWHEFHDARQCDCPEFEQDEDDNYTHNCCKDCGRMIFDGGTDGWQHSEVWDLTPAPQAEAADSDTDGADADGDIDTVARWLADYDAAQAAYEEEWDEEFGDYSDDGEAAFRDAMIRLAERAADLHRAPAPAAAPQAAEGMPAIVFDNEAAEGWAATFDTCRWNATFTLLDGTTRTGRILGHAVRASDGFYAVEAAPVDADWEVVADAESFKLACDEFTRVTLH